MKKILFIGRLSPIKNELILGSQPAGNIVQRELSRSVNQMHSIDAVTKCVAFNTISYKSGIVYAPKIIEEEIEFQRLINLPFLRPIHQFFQTLKFLFTFQPNLIIIYNLYFVTAIPCLIYKVFYLFKVRIYHIILDLDYKPGTSFFCFSFFKNVYIIVLINFVRIFSNFILITQDIIDFFKLDPNKSIVFNGGAVRANQQIDSELSPKGVFAVFAGAIEPYNGIDVLIMQWLKLDISFPLHIFGNGSLASSLHQYSKSSKIIYHGLQRPNIVDSYLANSKFNFCLRYPKFLSDRFYFPSKFFYFFNFNSYIVVNRFANLPNRLPDSVLILDSSLNNLKLIEGYVFSTPNYKAKDNFMSGRSWSSLVSLICDR